VCVKVQAQYLAGRTDERPNPSFKILNPCNENRTWDLQNTNINLTTTFGVTTFPSGHITKGFPIKILYAFPDSTPELFKQCYVNVLTVQL
jgi:hypothetical protein